MADQLTALFAGVGLFESGSDVLSAEATALLDEAIVMVRDVRDRDQTGIGDADHLYAVHALDVGDGGKGRLLQARRLRDRERPAPEPDQLLQVAATA